MQRRRFTFLCVDTGHLRIILVGRLFQRHTGGGFPGRLLGEVGYWERHASRLPMPRLVSSTTNLLSLILATKYTVRRMICISQPHTTAAGFSVFFPDVVPSFPLLGIVYAPGLPSLLVLPS